MSELGRKQALVEAIEILVDAQACVLDSHSMWQYVREAFTRYKCPFSIVHDAGQYLIDQFYSEVNL
jgi:hypothetical protein